jgi:nicotinamidase-related amidase
MNSIVHLRDFDEWRGCPTLVLVDLHRGLSEDSDGEDAPDLTEPLANCQAALEHSRQRGFPVAFLRQVESSPLFGATVRLPSWFRGFEPRRSEMVFDRQFPSCYANQDFAEVVDASDGNYVLAGLFGETSCLSTAVDAFHRNHRFTYLADASTSRSHHGVPALAMHKSVTSIVALYGKVARTRTWVRLTSEKAEV